MDDKLSELLPCPFCGCTDISEGEVLTDNPDGGASTQSMCRGCGALGPDAHLREGEVDFGSVKSTAAWNRRAPPAPAIPAETMSDQQILDIAKRVTPAFRESPASCIALVREAFKAAPAISKSDDAQDAARYRWLQRQRAHVWHEIADMPINRTNERIDAAIDAARKGEKS